MAKTPKQTADSAKATKLRRYRAVEGGMEFLMVDGSWERVLFSEFHSKAETDCRFYGAGQKWQDAAYAKSKDEPAKTREEQLEILAGYKDGTLFERTRGTGGPTMQKTAAAMYGAKYREVHGKAPDSDTLKAGVAKWLQNEESKEYKAVKAAYDQQVATAGLDL